MKFDKNKAFPYPVLRPFSDDYIDVEFQATIEFLITKDNIKANVSYAISSEDITKAIQEGAAEYVTMISCRDTYYQHTISSSQRDASAEIDIGELRGEVRVNPYVVAKKNIPAFSSADINPEFGPGPFAFAVGDVLAQDEAQIFYFDRDFLKPVTSVFDLVKKDEQTEGIWTVGFDDDHIQIEVSPKMKESIDNARNSKANRAILINSIYFGAVMQAIQKLQNEDTRETYSEKKWAKVIMAQAHNKGCDIAGSDSYLIAERLMQTPLRLLDTYVFKGSEQ